MTNIESMCHCNDTLRVSLQWHMDSTSEVTNRAHVDGGTGEEYAADAIIARLETMSAAYR